MAAPTSKPSPSNQSIQQTQTNECKQQDPISNSPSSSSSTTEKAKTTTTTIRNLPPPTYRSVESSESYLVAKQFLNQGNFEKALTLLEQELQNTKMQLLQEYYYDCNCDGGGGGEVKKDDLDLHESIAPLHYLYGTTLLYSLEEAKEDGDDMKAITMTTTTMIPTEEDNNDDEPQDEEEEEEEDGKEEIQPQPLLTAAWKMPEGNAATAAASNNGGGSTTLTESGVPSSFIQKNDNDVPNTTDSNTLSRTLLPSLHPNHANDDNDDDDTEEIQIAWENFEVARTIVERMLTQPGLEPKMKEKLQLDLAQILLREGDLQRMNGQYDFAIQDYQSCLQLRQHYLQPWDRKIADTQFNLGLTYLSSSSELQKQQVAAGTTTNTTATPDDQEESDTNHPLPKAPALLAKEQCEKGIVAYVACAKTLAGILAQYCGTSPETFLESATCSDQAKGVQPAVAVTAGLKTTGLEDEQMLSTAEASQTLNTLRKAVATLIASRYPPANTVTAAATDSVYEIQQVLDDIQETVDEAEQSLDAVRQAAQIKAYAQQQAAAAQSSSNSDPADGSVVCTSMDGGVTTTIGFGALPTTTFAAAATASNMAVSVAAATTRQPQQQSMMMVVKKKKKKRNADDDNAAENSKPVAPAPSNKRAKTDE